MRVKEDNPGNKTLPSGKCCECPKTEQEMRVEEDERRFQIEFENYLHNYVYQKRPVKSSTVSTSRKRSRREAEFMRTTTNDISNTSLIIYGNKTVDDGDDDDEDDEYLAAIVYNKREIILPNLRHFQTYSIEVVACQEYDPDADKKLCSNRAIITATTEPSGK
jgi:hypothetical protein